MSSICLEYFIVEFSNKNKYFKIFPKFNGIQWNILPRIFNTRHDFVPYI